MNRRDFLAQLLYGAGLATTMPLFSKILNLWTPAPARILVPDIREIMRPKTTTWLITGCWFEDTSTGYCEQINLEPHEQIRVLDFKDAAKIDLIDGMFLLNGREMLRPSRFIANRLEVYAKEIVDEHML